MKQALVFCLAVLLALGLCACSPAESGSTYTVTKDGVEYMVDQENSTISDGTYTYYYTVSGNYSSYSIQVTYPDGSTYTWSSQRNGDISSSSGMASMDYDANRYVGGDVLCRIIEAGAPETSEGGGPGTVLVAIFLLAAGLFNIISPHSAWYLRYGWRYKDTEPSELALAVGRIGGIVIVIIAVILFLSSL